MEMEEVVREAYDLLKACKREVDQTMEETMGYEVTKRVLTKCRDTIDSVMDLIGADIEKEYELFDDDEMPKIKVVSEDFISDD